MSPIKHSAANSKDGSGLSVEAGESRVKEGQPSSSKILTTGKIRTTGQFSLRTLLLGFTLFSLFCGLILTLPAFISQILIGAAWIASAGWLVTGICFAQGDQRAFCIGAFIVIASMWTGVGARFVEGMTSFLAILGAWTSSGQIARWLELVLLLLAAIANGRLAVRARHYFEREMES
jgi:hypothetical protein